MISIREDVEVGTASPFQSEVEGIFSETGILSGAASFEYRAEQQRMAGAVARTIETGGHLVVEAGTGVGKSLAYLVPAALHAVRTKRKAVICTHTIALQEQLMFKDIPLVQKIVPDEFEAVLLKGRQNYLCTTRLARALDAIIDSLQPRYRDALHHRWLRSAWTWGEAWEADYQSARDEVRRLMRKRNIE